MCGIRNPNRSQFAGAVQLGQHHSIPAVGLHPITRLHRDQGRRHHDAIVPQLDELTIEAIAAGTRLIAEMQPRPPGAASFSASLRT